MKPHHFSMADSPVLKRSTTILDGLDGLDGPIGCSWGWISECRSVSSPAEQLEHARLVAQLLLRFLGSAKGAVNDAAVSRLCAVSLGKCWATYSDLA